MPSCAAPGCLNSFGHGIKMNSFPKDASRRTKWLVNMNRKNWSPNNKSVLCEAHFEVEMWEKQRVDGKKKLKSNAVPTIFHVSKTLNQPTSSISRPISPISRRIPILRKNLIIRNSTDVVPPVHYQMDVEDVKNQPTSSISRPISPISRPIAILRNNLIIQNSTDVVPPVHYQMDVDKVYEDVKNQPTSSISRPISPISRPKPILRKNLIIRNSTDVVPPVHYQMDVDEMQYSESDRELDEAEEELKKEKELEKRGEMQDEEIKRLRRMLKKSENLRIAMTRRYKKLRDNRLVLKKEVKRLNNEVNNSSRIISKIKQIYGSDQITLLTNSCKKITKWSDSTLDKAYKLRLSCGTNGYQELLKQGHPLPALRTLRKNLEGFTFTEKKI